MVVNTRLGGVIPHFFQCLQGGNVPVYAQGGTQQAGLVIAPLFQSLLADRHPCNGVKLAAVALGGTLSHHLPKAVDAARLAVKLQIMDCPTDTILVEKGRGDTFEVCTALYLFTPRQRLFAPIAQQFLSHDSAAERTSAREEQVHHAAHDLIDTIVHIFETHSSLASFNLRRKPL